MFEYYKYLVIFFCLIITSGCVIHKIDYDNSFTESLIKKVKLEDGTIMAIGYGDPNKHWQSWECKKIAEQSVSWNKENENKYSPKGMIVAALDYVNGNLSKNINYTFIELPSDIIFLSIKLGGNTKYTNHYYSCSNIYNSKMKVTCSNGTAMRVYPPVVHHEY